jgi:hypothetical protein
MQVATPAMELKCMQSILVLIILYILVLEPVCQRKTQVLKALPLNIVQRQQFAFFFSSNWRYPQFPLEVTEIQSLIDCL